MADRHVPRLIFKRDRALFWTLGRMLGWRFAERVIAAVKRARRRERANG